MISNFRFKQLIISDSSKFSEQICKFFQEASAGNKKFAIQKCRTNPNGVNNVISRHKWFSCEENYQTWAFLKKWKNSLN